MSLSPLLCKMGVIISSISRIVSRIKLMNESIEGVYSNTWRTVDGEQI